MDKETKKAVVFKSNLLEKAKETLKQEFIGLDKIIDELTAYISAWYLFPQLQERPLIINLWGMTGVGKSALVRTQIDLIAPKVVITDKTTFNAYKVIYANDTLGIDKTSNPRVFSHGNRYIIRFYHPSYFGKKAIWLFNELQKCLDVINNHK
jgi:hypothetical protein